jgi:hypothetical protein
MDLFYLINSYEGLESEDIDLDVPDGFGAFIGYLNGMEAVNGRRQSGTSMPSKFWFWDVMEGGGCAGFGRGREGLEWHLSWCGSVGWMA